MGAHWDALSVTANYLSPPELCVRRGRGYIAGMSRRRRSLPVLLGFSVLLGAMGCAALRAVAAPATPPAALVVTLRAPDSRADLRNAFVREAVDLALRRTQASDGPYRLAVTKPMNKPRALREAARQAEPNLLVVTSTESGRDAGLVPVRFPIHLGTNRYRVCFVHAPRQPAVRAVDSVAALAQLRIVQGRNWPDVAVLRASGLNVAEVGTYDAMFKMVAMGRADLFCRNVLEIGHEIQTHDGAPGLALEDSLLLSYDLPQYLYTHADNRQAIDRVERGLKLAFSDGSLQALLRRYMQPSLALLNLPQRRLLALQVPASMRVEMDDRPYQIDLLRKPGR